MALCDIIGVIGAKYLIEQVNTLIYENLIKIKAIVSQNKEVLQSLRINFDRPDMMKDLYRRLESRFFKLRFYLEKKTHFKSFSCRIAAGFNLKTLKKSDPNFIQQSQFLDGKLKLKMYSALNLF